MFIEAYAHSSLILVASFDHGGKQCFCNAHCCRDTLPIKLLRTSNFCCHIVVQYLAIDEKKSNQTSTLHLPTLREHHRGGSLRARGRVGEHNSQFFLKLKFLLEIKAFHLWGRLIKPQELKQSTSLKKFLKLIGFVLTGFIRPSPILKISNHCWEEETLLLVKILWVVQEVPGIQS